MTSDFSRREPDERGANLVEFAILAPLLLLLVIGIVEFGWVFGQFNDVRHGTREGARFAAVDGGNEAAIQARVCNAMDSLNAGFSEVRVQLTDGTPDDAGQVATIRVEADVEPLTGVPGLGIVLPNTLTSEVEFRLEQESTNWTTTGAVPSC